MFSNMASVGSPELSEIFEGGGIAIDFNRSACLPPDMVGVAMGFEGASAINAMCTTVPDQLLPNSSLEVGVGSGVCSVALLHTVHNPENVTLTGFDIEAAACAITAHNLSKEMQRSDREAKIDIFAGDWYSDEVWRRLRLRTYDVIMCNPPYLAEGTPPMSGYERVPRIAMYAEGDGLAHHRFLLPRLLGLLSLRHGARLVARFHSTINGEYALSRSIDTLVDEAVMQAPPLSGLAIVRRFLAPVAPGRNMATVTISRVLE
jgi:methylase of polypeptide subunit release factors